MGNEKELVASCLLKPGLGTEMYHLILVRILSHSRMLLACVADALNLLQAYWVCELVRKLVHNVVFECSRVTRAYVGVFDWLVSNAFCDKSDLN